MKVICLLIATAIAAHAASTEPGRVAIDFLEKVRTGKIDLTPGADTALAPQTSDAKKREIAKRLQRLARDLGNAPLEVGSVKIDDDLAAVLVRKNTGFDPSQLQVFPIALVRRGDSWAAAPLPASFENAGSGYAITLKRRLEALENWMLREQVLDLEKLRSLSNSRMRQQIETALPAKELLALDSAGAAKRFLTACSERDQPAILGLLGGLSDPLPEDWPLRLKALVTAFNNPSKASRPWHFTLSPEVARTLVHHEDDDQNKGLFSIACLAPGTHESTPSAFIHVLHFELTKTPNGLWRIDPSASFLSDEESSEEEFTEDLDADLADQFATQWRAAHPASHLSTASLARDALASALLQPTLEKTLALCHFHEDAHLAGKSAIAAATLWAHLHAPSSVRHPVPLSFHEESDSAVALVHWFSAKNPDLLDLKSFYFSRTPDGWLWTPVPSAAAQASFSAALAQDTAQWSSRWQQPLLSESIELSTIPEGSAPDSKLAQTLVDSWLQAIKAGDVKTALSLTARLRDPLSSINLLRNLGHEINGYRKNNSSPTPAGTFQGKFITGVGMKVDLDAKPSFPFYPVIQTPRGPKILLEIDLFASRARDFLNKTSLERLQKLGLSSPSDELRTLLKDYQSSLPTDPPR